MPEIWNIGDIAVCIDANNLNNGRASPPLLVNYKYIANDVNICDCGHVMLDIGIKTDSGGVTCNCGVSIKVKGGWWCSSRRFTKQEKSEPVKDILKIN